MQNLINPYGKLAYVPGLSFAPYGTMGSISYPPFSAFIFAIIFRIYSLLGEPSRFLYYFMLKQPMVFADVGAAAVLAKIILLSGDAGSARRAVSGAGKKLRSDVPVDAVDVAERGKGPASTGTASGIFSN